MPVSPLRVLLFKNDYGFWIAQGLERDISGQARSREGAKAELVRMLFAHVASCVETGRDPLEALPPAPPKYVARFEASSERDDGWPHVEVPDSAHDMYRALLGRPAEVRVGTPPPRG